MAALPNISGQNSLLDQEHPYLGLESFQETDSIFFHGRTREQEELFRLIRRDVLTVVFGVSGLGKTSLLNAGLFPKLREAYFLPISIRLTFGEQAPDYITQVKDRIAAEIHTHCVDTPVPSDQSTLWEYFHETPLWNQKNRLLTPILVFDQFEEIFTLGRDDERIPHLLEQLGDLIENRIPTAVTSRLMASGEELSFNTDKPKAKVILSLREDYLAHLEEICPLIPSLNRNRFRLTHMNGEQALEPIMKPGADLVNAEVAEQIVRFVAGAGVREGQGSKATTAKTLEKLAIESALLSLVCRELNTRRLEKGQSQITAESLEAGQGQEILANFYERSLADMPAGIRIFIEDQLLTASGFRSTKAVEDAIQSLDVTQELLDKLINRRLLRKEERLGIPHVELIHDVLTGVIMERRSERQKEEERRRETEERLKLKKERFFLTGLSLVFLLMAIGAVFLWQKAERATNMALARQLTAQSTSVLTQHPEALTLSTLLTLESLRHAPTPTGIGATITSLFLNRKELARLTHDEDEWVNAVAFSPDGTRLATASDDGTARLWEAATGKELARLAHDEDEWVNAVAFSPDGTRLATASGDPFGGKGTARLWEAATGKELARLTHDKSVSAVAFSPDGTRLATASGDGTARVWPWRAEDLIRIGCSLPPRNLTPDEWQRYLEDEAYRPTCPNLPVPPN